MKLDEALRNVTRLGFDTAPVIYLIEAHPRYDALVLDILNRMDGDRFAGTTSVITLSEVLVQPVLRGDIRLQQAYRELLLQSQRVRTMPIGPSAAEHAANLRARYRLRLPDALQLAIALGAGCEAFLTNDMELRRVTELRILVLDDLE